MGEEFGLNKGDLFYGLIGRGRGVRLGRGEERYYVI